MPELTIEEMIKELLDEDASHCPDISITECITIIRTCTECMLENFTDEYIREEYAKMKGWEWAKTAEEMAEALGKSDCPSAIFKPNRCPDQYRSPKYCLRCWKEYATPAEISKRYAEMEERMEEVLSIIFEPDPIPVGVSHVEVVIDADVYKKASVVLSQIAATKDV